jgi:HK97 family phage major capsid protein
MRNRTTTAAYDREFWNALRGAGGDTAILREFEGYGGDIPPSSLEKQIDAMRVKHNIFRRIGTVITTKKVDSHMKGVTSDGDAAYIDEGGPYPKIGANYTDFKIRYKKIAKSTVFTTEVYYDSGFDLTSALAVTYGKAFGRAEERGAILGDGVSMPNGILNADHGAEVGATAGAAVSFDDIARLYFAVMPEYRQGGSWLMNDKTALLLRTLKDSAGNPLWRHTDDTMLGKPVYISEFMPDIGAGAKPIAFGDFSHYWLVELGDMAFRSLVELYQASGLIGVIGMERVDGVLVKRDAIKVMEIV